jgi:hypothetical protein
MPSTGDASSPEPHDEPVIRVSEEAARAVQDSVSCDADEPVLDVSEASAIALQGSRAFSADEPFFDGSAESAGDGPLVEDGDGPVLDLSEESAIAVQALLEARWAQEHGGGADERDGGSRRADLDDDSLGARQRSLLDASAESLRADARSLAARVRALHELIALSEHPDEPGERRFLELEVAGSCRVGQLTAGRWLGEAERYVTALPLTLSLLETGELLPLQATAVLHATSNVTPELARAAEAEVLPAGCALCPSDLKRKLTRVVLRLEAESDPDAVADRHAIAAADRHVFTRPEPDGMAQAGAVLTAEQARSWSLGLDTLEKAERISDREAGIERSADQRRADLFAALPALLLQARAELAAVGLIPSALSSREVASRLVLSIHVPVATVLDLSQEPGRLDGYGPIAASHIRLVTPVAYRRVLVDADTGRPLHVGDLMPADPDPARFRAQVRALLPTALETIVDTAEPQHDPSTALARLVDLRDVRCAGPGCGSTRCHRDHLLRWPDGPTAAWNLGLLSGRCHAAKHAGWTLTRHVDGSVSWTSPLGRTYHRPSPHAPPPKIDPYADSPPIRPAPTPPPRWGLPDETPWPAATSDPLASVPAEPAEPTEPDDEPPPF